MPIFYRFLMPISQAAEAGSGGRMSAASAIAGEGAELD